MYHLKTTRRTQQDARQIIDRYENIQHGLGGKFIDDYYEAFQKIKLRPESLRLKSGDIRYVRLKNYPYLVFFRLFENSLRVVVFAVLHEKRHPDAWKKRIPKK